MLLWLFLLCCVHEGPNSFSGNVLPTLLSQGFNKENNQIDGEGNTKPSVSFFPLPPRQLLLPQTLQAVPGKTLIKEIKLPMAMRFPLTDPAAPLGTPGNSSSGSVGSNVLLICKWIPGTQNIQRISWMLCRIHYIKAAKHFCL